MKSKDCNMLSMAGACDYGRAGRWGSELWRGTQSTGRGDPGRGGGSLKLHLLPINRVKICWLGP